jgi:Leucine-rich repeat (LRR) protein
MKKLYTLLVIALIGFVGKAQIVNIPDANFKAKLLEAGPSNYIASTQTPEANGTVTTFEKIDTNNDGEIQVSEALAIKWLKVTESTIANLTGIESFTNLKYLNCSYNQLPSLNVSGLTNLGFIDCSYNQLPSLDLSGLTNLQFLNCGVNLLPSLNVSGLTNLYYLDCSYNQLPSLNVSSLTNLGYLNCRDNFLPSINVSGLTNLQTLDCRFNQLTSLNVSGLTNLQYLYCNSNQLPSLDVSDLTNLQELNCRDNQLPSLNVSGLTNLISLSCSSNQLPSLNVSGLTNLGFIDCSYNQLPSINVSGLTVLAYIDCSNNQLPSIDVSGLTYLQSLDCSYNQLTSIDVSGFTFLNFLDCNNNQLISLFVKNGRNENIAFNNNPNLQYICADEGQIASIQNQITQYGYANCHVNSYCSFTPGGTFYTIQGNNRYDSNDNGCDASDINFPNFKLSFTDGTNTGNLIADTTGAFHYDVQAGTQTFTPTLENPAYFNVSPTTASVTFPTTASPFTQNFCITANGVKNDLEVTIIPIEVARPGFDATYKIIYKNKGNQVANGSLSFAFNDTVMDLVTATPVNTGSATNSLSWTYSNLNPFETREINLTFNINSPMETPAVNGGDVLNYSATIVGATDETPTDNVFSLNQTVVNSYDPNDKTCLEGTTITPSMVGNYVHYVIRFENTGTFAAQNVVIKDMIDTTKFDISSLIPQSSSHPFVTKITNTNKVEFIFENINLPFDDANNDGYVAFKIKTKPTLVLGNTFTNTAGIYFDYNFPIVTNTTTTTVATLGNQDFDFGSVFSLSPVPAKNSLTISTKQTVVVSSVSIYNTLGQLVQVHTNPNETIDVSSLQSGSYFVRITSDKGSANGKFLKE